jgi:xanthine dehydrogenase accessory factor
MRRETLEAINRAREAGHAVVRATNLKTGEEILVDPASDQSALGIAAADAARADQSRAVDVDGRTWFLSLYNPPLDLVIVGAAHIAQPLATMSALTGYGVRIVDPRTAFATVERFPDVAISHDWPDEALAKAPLGFRSALVALAHDPKIDDPALIAALKSPCYYIGALGSRKSHAARLARLRKEGFSEAGLARIHGPVGLNIAAKSPAEIAVSILAEMIRDLRASPASPTEPAREPTA